MTYWKAGKQVSSEDEVPNYEERRAPGLAERIKTGVINAATGTIAGIRAEAAEQRARRTELSNARKSAKQKAELRYAGKLGALEARQSFNAERKKIIKPHSVRGDPMYDILGIRGYSAGAQAGPPKRKPPKRPSIFDDPFS